MSSLSRLVSGLRRGLAAAVRPGLRYESTETALETRPTVRKFDPVVRENMTDFGQYVAQCMPKYVQKVQLTAGDELEILVAPSGVVPVMSFLKNHHNAQFGCLVDIAGVDVPTREYRSVNQSCELSLLSLYQDLRSSTTFCLSALTPGSG